MMSSNFQSSTCFLPEYILKYNKYLRSKKRKNLSADSVFIYALLFTKVKDTLDRDANHKCDDPITLKHDEIANRGRMSEEKVKKGIKELEYYELIEIIKGNNGDPDQYLLPFHEWMND
jgi:hypothetical protein